MTQDTTECVFRLPDLGEGLVAGEIIEWLVDVGARVEVDQPVVVVETEKTTTELPTPFRGQVIRLHGEPGDMVPVGAPLVTIEGAAASTITHLVGQRPDAAVHSGSSDTVRLPPKTERGPAVAASPAVRRLARELDVDLRGITGTGKGGAITKDDVQRAHEGTDG